MKVILFILTLSFLSFSEVKEINVINELGKITLDNSQSTYNIVVFEYTNPDVTNHENDTKTIKVGLTTTQNLLVDLIWEYQPISNIDGSNIIQSIEILDLNNDGLNDIIINYIDLESSFSDQIISSFLIHSKNKFIEISETFIKKRYLVFEKSHIKYESPLTMFGRPYEEEDPQKNSIFWVDYYEFQESKLVNINQKYKHFFESFKKDANKNLNNLLEKIKHFKMSEELTTNQLQLEEYFNQISELKIIIYRCNQVLR